MFAPDQVIVVADVDTIWPYRQSPPVARNRIKFPMALIVAFAVVSATVAELTPRRVNEAPGRYGEVEEDTEVEDDEELPPARDMLMAPSDAEPPKGPLCAQRTPAETKNAKPKSSRFTVSSRKWPFL